MAIDTSGKWWRGESFEDLAEYLRLLTEEGYPADVIKEAACDVCASRSFVLRARREEGAAKLICGSCGAEKYIADSADHFGRAKGATCKCPCGATAFNIGVGFSLRESGDVRWVTVGERCIACGVLGSFVDWKVDYAPASDLVDNM